MIYVLRNVKKKVSHNRVLYPILECHLLSINI